MDRYNIYTFIHKGLRQALFRQLTALGQLDETNPVAVRQTLNSTTQLLLCLRQHQQHEDDFIQPLLPLFNQYAQEHDLLEQQLSDLLSLTERIHSLPSVISAALLHQLYQQLALFCADLLHHMHTEETRLMEQLWRNYTDEQLQDVHQQLMQSMSAEQRQQNLNLILSAVTDTERLTLLLGLKQQLQQRDFAQLLSTLEPALSQSQHTKLHSYIHTNHSALYAL